MSNGSARERFNAWVVPHLDAAYNLARWLMRDEERARDMVQEACLRAFRHIDGFRGGSGKSWLLTIVRNACYTELQESRWERSMTEFDEGQHSFDPAGGFAQCLLDGPEAAYLRGLEREQLRRFLEALPVEQREILVLRELEGLSYKEISAMAAIPLGTVMSRLARARSALQACLADQVRGVAKS